ncbi:MAG: small subunit ribosomal protein S4e [Candidatus Diapherotrites archaeon]|nr:small subunit ribosomal protein S4e [Candidatus Diapherotrites archaeon]MDN5366934.1 small subunit ribosomal protein S4e [Candidatus Diapherotrites archaeon]
MALVGGGSRHLKRLAAPKSWKIKRKRRFGVWVTRTIPGPHPKERALPLRVLIRDLLGVANNAREADFIVRSGKVLVDGVVRKDPRFPVGLFDVVEIPEIKKVFRILLDEQGRLVPKEIPEGEKNIKIVRVERKVMVKGGRIQLGTHDGRSFLLDDAKEVRPGDVLKITVPDQKIQEIFHLKEGNLVYVLSGRHAGTLAKILAVNKGDVIRERSVDLSVEDEKIQTAARNVFVVGRDSPAITL